LPCAARGHCKQIPTTSDRIGELFPGQRTAWCCTANGRSRFRIRDLEYHGTHLQRTIPGGLRPSSVTHQRILLSGLKATNEPLVGFPFPVWRELLSSANCRSTKSRRLAVP
jgi:hypothetical protein